MADPVVGEQSRGVFIRLEEGEVIHVLHPKMIIAFRGAPSLREDRFMNLKGMFRKKKLLQANITGPAELVLALPPGFYMKPINVEDKADFLFDIRNILFYSKGIQMKSVILKIRNMLVTRDVLKMKFFGTGSIGVLTKGPVHELKLMPEVPVFVDTGCLVAYPESAKVDLCVYGNHLASQHMNYQWELRGSGSVLLQTGKSDREMERDTAEDGIVKRILREILPFGGVIIK